MDTAACTEAFDLNPASEAGAENFGNTSAAFNFDIDFDGIEDVIVGYRNQDPWSGPSQTELWFGQGNGTFANPVTIRSFPSNDYGTRFAVPARLCTRFPL